MSAIRFGQQNYGAQFLPQLGLLNMLDAQGNILSPSAAQFSGGLLVHGTSPIVAPPPPGGLLGNQPPPPEPAGGSDNGGNAAPGNDSSGVNTSSNSGTAGGLGTTSGGTSSDAAGSNRTGNPGSPSSGPGSYSTPGSIGGISPGGFVSTGLGLVGAPTGLGTVVGAGVNTLADQLGFSDLAAKNGIGFSTPGIGSLANNFGYNAVKGLTFGMLDPTALGFSSPSYQNAVDQAQNVAQHDLNIGNLSSKETTPEEDAAAQAATEKSLQEGMAQVDAEHPAVTTSSLDDSSQSGHDGRSQSERDNDPMSDDGGQGGGGSPGDGHDTSNEGGSSGGSNGGHEGGTAGGDHDDGGGAGGGGGGGEGHDSEGGGGGDGDAKGGLIGKAKAFSGRLKGPGTPTSDSIPTRQGSGKGPNVSTGEYVDDAKTTEYFGPKFFQGLKSIAHGDEKGAQQVFGPTYHLMLQLAAKKSKTVRTVRRAG